MNGVHGAGESSRVRSSHLYNSGSLRHESSRDIDLRQRQTVALLGIIPFVT
jgi:hypothetical protein